MNDKVEIVRKHGNDECYTANGLLFCLCGKCELEDYKLPDDFV